MGDGVGELARAVVKHCPALPRHGVDAGLAECPVEVAVPADFVLDASGGRVGTVEEDFRRRDRVFEEDLYVAWPLHLGQVEVHQVVLIVGRDGLRVAFVGGVEGADAGPDGPPVVAPFHGLRGDPNALARGT